MLTTVSSSRAFSMRVRRVSRQRSMSDLLSMRHEAVCMSSLMARFFFEEFGIEVGGGGLPQEVV